MGATRSLMATVIAQQKVYGGDLIRFTHESTSTKCNMTAAIYLPPGAKEEKSIPMIMYLSGLTCTDENVCMKGAPFRMLAEQGLAFLCPDTSHRATGTPDELDMTRGIRLDLT